MTDRHGLRVVLVIEDEDNIATALEYVIVREGFEYRRIDSGAKAVAAIRTEKPDLVLLDVMLPEMSGYDICREVRSDRTLQKTKIIMMTARGSAVQRAKCLDLGADGFITKPFDLQSLRSEINRHILRQN